MIPGREEKFYEHARTIEKTIAEQPDALAVLKLHYLRWLMFPINGETHFMYRCRHVATDTQIGQPSNVQMRFSKLPMSSHAKTARGLVRDSNAFNPLVRFDERGVETELRPSH